MKTFGCKPSQSVNGFGTVTKRAAVRTRMNSGENRPLTMELQNVASALSNRSRASERDKMARPKPSAESPPLDPCGNDFKAASSGIEKSSEPCAARAALTGGPFGCNAFICSSTSSAGVPLSLNKSLQALDRSFSLMDCSTPAFRSAADKILPFTLVWTFRKMLHLLGFF